MPDANAALEMPIWLEMGAVVVGVAGGTLVACKRKLDILGGVGLGIICGLGGGLVRDSIMQVGSVYMIDSPLAIPVAVTVALLVFFFHGAFERIPAVIEWLDIASVALFAATGTDKAVVYGLSPIAAIFMGLLTANGGGMLRDVFLGDVPRMFQKSNLYAMCGLLGAFSYWVCVVPLRLPRGICATVCVAMTMALRGASLHFDWQSPADVDLSASVARPLRHLTRRNQRHQ